MSFNQVGAQPPLPVFLKGVKMAKKEEKKEEREISREERVTGKRPVDESVGTLDKDSREVRAKGD